MIDERTQPNFSRSTTSFSATLPFPKSGPPETTTRVGSPSVCESITLIAAAPSQSPQSPPAQRSLNSHIRAPSPPPYPRTSHTSSIPARQTLDRRQKPVPPPSAAPSRSPPRAPSSPPHATAP